jgi:hypothetical protein
MTEIHYAILSVVLVLLIIAIPQLAMRYFPSFSIKFSTRQVFAIVILFAMAPKVFFTCLTFSLGPDDAYPKALNGHFWEMLWHGNFESPVKVLILYFTSFLSFGTNLYHPIIMLIVSLASTILGTSILAKLKTPTLYVITVPILLSWMRMYPELVWLDHHDVFIIFFALLFISTFIDFARAPNLKNSLLCGISSLLYLSICPTNFIILPVLFLLLILCAVLFNAPYFKRGAISICCALLLLASAQCIKTYLSSGIFAPSAIGSQLFTLNLFRHYESQSEKDLTALFDRANVPYWYRTCFDNTPTGKPDNRPWHGSLGLCHVQYDPQNSKCVGPNYEFTRLHVIDASDSKMLAILARDTESMCTKGYLYTLPFPEMSTEFGYEYQKVNSKIVKTWLLTDPIGVIQNALFTRYPLYEVKGSPLLTSNFFAPLMLQGATLQPYRGIFQGISNVVKVFNLMMVLVFHSAIIIIILKLCLLLSKRAFLPFLRTVLFSDLAIWVMLLAPKLMAMVIYCVVAGSDGERYWQQFSWHMVCFDIWFLTWLSGEITKARPFFSKLARGCLPWPKNH